MISCIQCEQINSHLRMQVNETTDKIMQSQFKKQHSSVL